MKTILKLILFIDKWRRPLRTLDEWKIYNTRLKLLEDK